MSRETLIVTPTRDFSMGWPTANITTAATITEMLAQAGTPVGIANQVCVVGAAENIMEVMLWSSVAGGQLDCRAWGWRWNAAVGLMVPRLLVQFRATMRAAGAAVQLLGDTMHPAMSHAINVNNANAIALDGSDTWKVPGCLQFDTRGSKFVSFGVNPVTGTPKANLMAATH